MIAIMECIDREAWSWGLRFGSLGLTRPTRILNWRIGNAKYDVAAGPDFTELSRDGNVLFRASAALVV
jgi:hypothetical protein